MSSAEEVAKFKAEGENATADIGDVGFAFGPIAVEQGVTQPYKPSTWEEIPDWAKDEDGHWMLGYTGTIAFMINKELVPEDQRPGSFADLGEGDYMVVVGAVGQASQANNALLAAAYANDGSEADLAPGLEVFAELARQGRLSLADPSIANLEKGEIEVALMWDFNALNYRDQINPDAFEVVIPSDASVTSGYATIINRHAAHPMRPSWPVSSSSPTRGSSTWRRAMHARSGSSTWRCPAKSPTSCCPTSSTPTLGRSRTLRPGSRVPASCLVSGSPRC
ncbi:hypothetical protein A8U91_00344 [Halomonas elongata]|uniref:Uncharacterized protein n=1 Tax=Halomonas elongata TaxID=2746 RepID=A0A1B8P1B4_HALEL|nr:extracellular solute-binding protein [Halomonas elongata]OBX36008.1 hypothetical protein A8U91_00344 [Halomonas elongata]